MRAPKHNEERYRIDTLHRYEILDTEYEAAYDDITRLAAQICQTPISVINFIDGDRQWFKSEVGLGVRETPIELSLCAHTILQPGLFIVPDTLQDERFTCNPLVMEDPGLRFYAGAPLESSDGYPLGTLCVLDYQPRELNPMQQEALITLSRQVMANLELRLRAREVEDLNRRLKRNMTESHHRVKNSMQLIAALVDMQASCGAEMIPVTELQRVSQHIRGISTIHDLLTQASKSHTHTEYLSADASLGLLLPLLQDQLMGRRLNAAVTDTQLSIKQATSLTMLISELVSNAIKHGEGEDIDLVFAVSDGTARLEIANAGRGFPENFSPTTSANTGLSLVESLGRWDLKGDIQYLNGPEGGARVIVTFPLNLSPLPARDEKQEPV